MVTLTPAYGRDYKSKKSMLADFKANKDFIINDLHGPLKHWDGKPINREDLKRDNISAVMIRYDRLTKIIPVNIS